MGLDLTAVAQKIHPPWRPSAQPLCAGVGLVHLAGATALEALTLAFTGVGDGALRHLADLTALEHLNLDSCAATDQCAPPCRPVTRTREESQLTCSSSLAVIAQLKALQCRSGYASIPR